MSNNHLLIRDLLTLAWVSAAALYDLRARRLPNWLAGLGIVLAAGSWMLGPQQLDLITSIALLTASLMALLLFACNIWGAGDAKFLVILLLVFPSTSLFISTLAAVLGSQVGGLAYSLVRRQDTSRQSLPLVTCMAVGWAVWSTAKLLLETSGL